MTINERLRERREAAELTQGQVAEYEGVVRSYISNLERGTNEPAVWELLARLARRYGTSADYLLGLTDDPTGRGVVQVGERRAVYVADEVGVHREAQRLLDVWGRLDRWRRRELVFVARGMLTAQEAEMAAAARGEGEAVSELRSLLASVESRLGGGVRGQLEQFMLRLLAADEGELLALLATLEEQLGDAVDDGEVE